MITKEEKLTKLKFNRYIVLILLLIFISTLLACVLYLVLFYELETFHLIFWSIIGVLTLVLMGKFVYDNDAVIMENINNNNGWISNIKLNKLYMYFIFFSITILSLLAIYYYYLHGFNFISIFLIIIIIKHIVITTYFSFDSKKNINLEYKTFNDVEIDQSHKNIDEQLNRNNIVFTKEEYDHNIWSTKEPVDFKYKLEGNVILTITFPFKKKNFIIRELNCILKLYPEISVSNSDLNRYKILLNKALEI